MIGARPLSILSVLVIAVFLNGCSHLFFYPYRELVYRPQQLGLQSQDVFFTTADGLRLHGWFLPAKGRALGTVLFLHGNAENISTHIGSVWWLPGAGFNVLLFDYRGYGRSAGSPSIAGLQQDARAALAEVLRLPQVDPERVALYGQSLGAAVAISALADFPQRLRFRALVVASGFTGYRAIAREKFAAFWLTWPLQWPLSLTISDRYRPVDDIARISPVPVLIVHGTDDPVIPVHHARELFAAAREPKALWLIEGADHFGVFRTAAERERLVGYLRERFQPSVEDRM